MTDNNLSWSDFKSLRPSQRGKYLESNTNNLTNLIYTQQLNKTLVDELFHITDIIYNNKNNNVFMSEIKNMLSTKACSLYFPQCSTRTFTSFSFAAQSLGMMVEEIRDIELSAMYKGESELDTLLTLSSLSDMLITRQMDPTLTEQIAYEIRSRNLSTKIINGGSGADQHPTQALLELYTILSYLDLQDNSVVCFVGDLLRARAARSLAYLLALYPNVKQVFIAPDELQIGDDVKSYLDENNIQYQCINSLDDGLKEADAVYVMRIQDEYSMTSEMIRREYEKYHLSLERVKMMKQTSCIIHPLPRRFELPIEIDADHRAKYWEAVQRGKYLRTSLIAYMFGRDKDIIDLYGDFSCK